MTKSYLVLYLNFLAIFLPAVAFSQDDNVQLYHHVNQWGGTNIWLVSLRSLTNAPKWMGEKEPPLSVGQAVKIATKQLVLRASNQTYWIEDIRLTPFAPTSHTGIYYYNIVIGGTSFVGHSQRCIILMNGTVVQPEILGAKPQKKYEPWEFDE